MTFKSFQFVRCNYFRWTFGHFSAPAIKLAHLYVCWGGTSALRLIQRLVHRGDICMVSPRCGSARAASDGSTFWSPYYTNCTWKRGKKPHIWKDVFLNIQTTLMTRRPLCQPKEHWMSEDSTHHEHHHLLLTAKCPPSPKQLAGGIKVLFVIYLLYGQVWAC